MTLSRLILREIGHRKTSFLLSVLGAAVAVGAVLVVVATLRNYDRQTESLVGEMEAQTEAEMSKLEDEIRKSMKGLGFNIYIFPEGQELSEVYAEGYATKTMPEEYVNRLAQSPIVTVNHLLPSLTRKLEWPEQKRTVILIGVRGEVPFAHKDPKKPLIDPVEKGSLVFGHELHRSLGLEKGGKVDFMDREFTVADTYPARGSKDDITIWMNLGECQELLDEVGRINAIQALECNCASVDRIGEIRAELMEILPDTQIIETESTALARAEARNQAAATSKAQIAQVKADRARLRAERQSLAGWLLPVVAVASMAWVGLLAFINVRERLPEIGILRAVGVKGQTILGAFLGRALLAGVLGGIAGVGLALAAKPTAEGQGVGPLLAPSEWFIAIFVATLLACLAAWLPSLAASRRDPAEVLRHD